jgi:O-antigen/teichoic acid export membrane protein
MIQGVRRSLMFSFGQKYALAMMNLLTTAVLARLLSPAEIGVFMVCLSLISMGDAFRDFGISSYLIQTREATLVKTRAAFTASLVLSLVLAGLLVAMSGEISVYYQEPGLRRVLYVAAGNFVLTPFVATIMALLRRDMAFDRIARINLITAFAYCVIVNGLAALGFSYMSLAWGALLSTCVSTVTAIIYRPEWRIFLPTMREWRPVISFGGISTSTSLLNVILWTLPQLVLGRVLGLDAVGVYNRAALLCSLFDRLITDGLNPVTLPAFAARARSGEELKTPYLIAIEYMTALYWPFLVCLALLADPVVHLVLGAQWHEVAPLLRIMAVASLWMFPAFLTYPVMVTTGRLRDTLTMSLLTIPASLALMFSALPFGLLAMAGSVLLTAPLQSIVALIFVRRQLHFTWRELAAATRRSVTITGCSAVGPGLMVALMESGFDLSLIEFALAALLAALGWIAGARLTGHPLLAESRRLLAALHSRASAQSSSVT